MKSIRTRSRLWLLASAFGIGLFGVGPGGYAWAAEEPQGQPAEPSPPAADEPSPPELPQDLEKAEVNKEKMLNDMYERLSDTEDAESAEVIADAIEKLWLRSGSDTIDLLMQRALQMVREERYNVALKLLDAVVALEPAYPEGWNQRATVNFLKKDYRSSMEDLRHVLRLDPRHFKAIGGLALILQEFGAKEAALRAFRKALAVHPYLDGADQAVRELTREVEGQGI